MHFKSEFVGFKLHSLLMALLLLFIYLFIYLFFAVLGMKYSSY